MGSVIIGGWLSRGDWIYPEQLNASQSIAFPPDEEVSLGQSFVARQAGLQAFQVKFSPLEADQSFILELKTTPADPHSVRQATVVVPASENDQWVSFSFEPLPDSRNHYYYVSVKSADKNSAASVFYGSPETYLDGVMYFNGQPQEGQLTFRLSYNRPLMLLDLAKGFILFVPLGIMVLLAFLLPGWAFWVLLFRRQSGDFTLHWLEGASVSFGFSLAYYPVLFLFAYALGVHGGVWYVWGSIALSATVLIWHYRLWRFNGRTAFAGLSAWMDSEIFWADIAAIALLVLALGGRFLMVRGLDMPLLGDSVQHTVLTRLVMDNGGLFQSWEPYAPYETFSFHFGFHVNSAVYGWVTGLDASQAVLWGGQFFNMLAVFALYPLAYRLKSAWAGAIALLIAGFFTQFPLYYTNWGRYPQVMGQIGLLIASWWTWITLTDERPPKNYLWFLGGAMLIAGTALSYYRMAFHYLAFVIAILLVELLPFNEFARNWKRWVILPVVALLTVLIMSPWIGNLMHRFLLPAVTGVAGTVDVVPPPGMWDRINLLFVRLPMKQMLVFVVGILGVAWWKKRAALPVIWMSILLLLPLLAVLPVPGVGIIQQFTIETSLYMPIALILGVFVAFFLLPLVKQWQLPGAIAVALILLALFKFSEIPQTLDKDYSFTGRPDILAADWINKNLPSNSFFLVNGIVYVDGKSSIGGDAGWWLPFLTQRGASEPPQYALLTEKPSILGYTQAVNNLVKQLSSVLPASSEGKQAICEFPIPVTHLYLGQNRGRGDKAGSSPPRPMLPAKVLLRDPAFKLIHQQDRVMIFEFDRSVCNE